MYEPRAVEAPLVRHSREYAARHALLAPNSAVLVGLSGGVDSVVLLHVLARLGHPVQAAHLNFGLRGAESDEDERWVRGHCADLGIPLHVGKADVALQAGAGESVQMTARRLRYAFLLRTASAAGLSCVAVGHHLDDQAETVLHNLFRGTGPDGLAGMPAGRPIEAGSEIGLVRPLLHARRRAIVDYARSEGLAWREDATNCDVRYARNRMRTVVLPAIAEAFGSAATEQIARSSALVRAYVEDTVAPVTSALFDRAADPDKQSLDMETLLQSSAVWRRRLILDALRQWLPTVCASSEAVRQVERLLHAQPGRRIAFGDAIVWRGRGRLVFQVAAPESGAVRLVAGCTVLATAGAFDVELLESRAPAAPRDDPFVELVDADRLGSSLTARPWQPGDRLRPLGMDGTKKVSDLLTDAKVPVARRKQVWVITSASKVVWVVGIRLSADFRVLPSTKSIVRLTFIPYSDRHQDERSDDRRRGGLH